MQRHETLYLLICFLFFHNTSLATRNRNLVFIPLILRIVTFSSFRGEMDFHRKASKQCVTGSQKKASFLAGVRSSFAHVTPSSPPNAFITLGLPTTLDGHRPVPPNTTMNTATIHYLLLTASGRGTHIGCDIC